MRPNEGTDSLVLPLRKYPRLAVAIFCLAVVVSSAYALFGPKVYEAVGGVLVTGGRGGSSQVFASGQVGLDSAVGSQKDLLMSEAVLKTAAGKTGWEGSLKLLAARLRVESALTSSYLRIVAQGDSPEEAAVLCDALLDAYDAQVKRQWRESALLDKEYWEQRIADAEDSLRQAEKVLEAFRAKHRLQDPTGQAGLVASATSDMERQLQLLRVEQARDSARLGAVKRQLGQAPALVTATQRLEASPLWGELKRQLNDIEVQLATAKAQYTDQHPTVREFQLKRDSLLEQLDRTAREQTAWHDSSLSPVHQQLLQSYYTLQASTSAASRAIGALKSELSATSGKAGQLPALQTQYSRLAREVQFSEQVLQEVVSAYEEAKTASTKTTSSAWVVQRAQALERPVFPRPLLLVALGVFLGAILALSLTLLVDQLDRVIRCPEDLARAFPELPALKTSLAQGLAPLKALLAGWNHKGVTSTLLCSPDMLPPELEGLLGGEKGKASPGLAFCPVCLTSPALPEQLAEAGAVVVVARANYTQLPALEATLALLAAAGQPARALVLLED